MTKYLNTKSGSVEDVVKQMQNKVLESDYQDKFKKELEKAGKPLGQMTGAEKKAFFNKIDKMHTAKNEQAKNPYAIGMAAAMKAKDDKPPLKKSTITKAHDIAKSIEKDMKKEDYTKKDVDKFHTKLDKLVHKSFGHSSDEKKKEMKKEEVHPHVKKMVKDGESDEKIKKMHPELKDDELKKLKETHMSTAKAQNQRQKDAKGEKEIVKTNEDVIRDLWEKAAEEKPEIKKEKKDDGENKDAQIATLKNQVNLLKQKVEIEKNQAVKPSPNPDTGEVPLTIGVAYKHLKDKMKKETYESKMKKEQEKENKTRTMTGKEKTPVEMSPKVDYKY